MGLEGIVSKRLGSIHKCKDWLKFKNPGAPAVKREAARRGRSQHDIGQPRIRFCFPDAAIADAFRDRFGGVLHDLRTRKVQVPHFDAHDRGSQKDQGK
jgi:hypothetical protein